MEFKSSFPSADTYGYRGPIYFMTASRGLRPQDVHPLVGYEIDSASFHISGVGARDDIRISIASDGEGGVRPIALDGGYIDVNDPYDVFSYCRPGHEKRFELFDRCGVGIFAARTGLDFVSFAEVKEAVVATRAALELICPEMAGCPIVTGRSMMERADIKTTDAVIEELIDRVLEFDGNLDAWVIRR